VTSLAEVFAHRHPSTVAILRYFDYGHLPPALQDVSRPCADLAREMVNELPDGPELTTGLRKLLEAKDCFVRVAVDQLREAEGRQLANTPEPFLTQEATL
jgi:hypothetical protein